MITLPQSQSWLTQKVSRRFLRVCVQSIVSVASLHAGRDNLSTFFGTHANLRHFTGQIESNYDEITDSFDSMNLKPELLRGVYAYGFERPSAIQQRAIMPVIKGT